MRMAEGGSSCLAPSVFASRFWALITARRQLRSSAFALAETPTRSYAISRSQKRDRYPQTQAKAPGPTARGRVKPRHKGRFSPPKNRRPVGTVMVSA